MKIWIYGGSFDPIHNGHLSLASFAIKELNLDKILFIPTYRPPEDYKEGVSDFADRLNMMFPVINKNDKFDIDECEVERADTSYTIDTIKDLLTRYPNDDLVLIGGPDCRYTFHTWKDYKEIEKLVEVKFAERDFYCPHVSIRATLIRELVQKQLPISYLVPKMVEDYIIWAGLYKEKKWIKKLLN